jgi:polysaccharide deacetylase family sporulation protein PdaB
LGTGGCLAEKRADEAPIVRPAPERYAVLDASPAPAEYYGPPAPPASGSPTPLPAAIPELTPPAAEPSTGIAAAEATPTPAPPVKKKDQPAAAKQAVQEKNKKGNAKQAQKSDVAAKANNAGTSLSELRKKYSDSFIFHGPSASKQIALTFDDAPDTVYTPKVLDILKKNGVKATFFIIGNLAEKHPEIVRRIVREGHVIGNHSYGHAQLKKLSQAKFIQEIEKTEQVLLPLVGYTPHLMRPPYGAVNDEELAWLKENGYLTVNWNVDPQDWKGLPGKEVYDRAVATAVSGSIILMHSATGEGGSLQGTVEALPDIIETLRGKGYKLVTLPELLQTKKGK